MKIKTAVLETVIGPTSSLPANSLPEVAFAGKSNVGKSSLINTLTCRQSLARTSSSPGKTRTINFFNINNSLYLVDLPGYGYANVPNSEKQRWGHMIERYLYGSETLRAVFLLVDIRHTPSENDRMMYDWIDYMGYQIIIIATKADKITRSATPAHIRTIRETFKCEDDVILIPFSSRTKAGLDDIYDLLDQVIENEES